MVKSNENNKQARKSYTNAFKRIAVLHYEQTNSKNQTAKNFGIKSRSTLRFWIAIKDLLFDPSQRPNSRKLITEENRKQGFFPESEKRIFEWYSSLKEEKIKVESYVIQNKMLEDVLLHNNNVL